MKDSLFRKFCNTLPVWTKSFDKLYNTTRYLSDLLKRGGYASGSRELKTIRKILEDMDKIEDTMHLLVRSVEINQGKRCRDLQ